MKEANTLGGEMAKISGSQPLIPTTGISDTLHIGIDDLPWMPIAGSEMQLLQVDLSQGLWITRARVHPGISPGKHYHTGSVFAVTQKGRWWYKETPHQVNSEGSYLFEPAMSMHTLVVPEEQVGTTDIWFAVYGANVDVDENNNVVAVMDANTILQAYRSFCDSIGASYEKMVVVGENLLSGR